MTDPRPGQRRRRSLAMTTEERDGLLGEARTCRVATVGADGWPHVTPLWFTWHAESLWLYSLTRSRRWADILADGRVAVVVDVGEAYAELRGAEFLGRAAPVGQQPRTGEPTGDPALDGLLQGVEASYAEKYAVADGGMYDGLHAWLRVTVEREYTWDFRKISSGF